MCGWITCPISLIQKYTETKLKSPLVPISLICFKHIADHFGFVLGRPPKVCSKLLKHNWKLARPGVGLPHWPSWATSMENITSRTRSGRETQMHPLPIVREPPLRLRNCTQRREVTEAADTTSRDPVCAKRKKTPKCFIFKLPWSDLPYPWAR